MSAAQNLAHGTLIIGAGQAGYQCAESLRQEGYSAPITLIGDEPSLPYQRPPLSKAYLLGDLDAERLLFRTPAYYAEQGIATRLATRVTGIDRAARTVQTETGEALGYDRLVIATGARVRPLPVPGADLAGIFYLRDLADVDRIEKALALAANVAVIGAGFIGLEFAAVASKLGKHVTVIEAMDRVMARAVTPDISAYFESVHRDHGVTLMLSTGVTELVGSAGHLSAIRTNTSHDVPADMVIVGIGVLPNVELAAAAGLEIDNGIVVDAHGRTSDPAIFAAGDCAAYAHPFTGQRQRLESVQNAADQARAVASAIAGSNKPYTAVPWFWSDQYDLKLQMVGLVAGCDTHVLRGDRDAHKFSIFHFRDGALRAVDSINKPADHMLARKLLGAGRSPTPAQVADADFPLKSLLD